MTTTAATPLHTAAGAYAGASTGNARTPTDALRTRSPRTASAKVFQSPLSAGGTDAALRRRAQRVQLATRVAAIGTVAAVVAVAVFAWRRARR